MFNINQSRGLNVKYKSVKGRFLLQYKSVKVWFIVQYKSVKGRFILQYESVKGMFSVYNTNYSRDIANQEHFPKYFFLT